MSTQTPAVALRGQSSDLKCNGSEWEAGWGDFVPTSTDRLGGPQPSVCLRLSLVTQHVTHRSPSRSEAHRTLVTAHPSPIQGTQGLCQVTCDLFLIPGAASLFLLRRLTPALSKAEGHAKASLTPFLLPPPGPRACTTTTHPRLGLPPSPPTCLTQGGTP